MKIILASVGTDGDVRPIISLGKSLQARGHEIIICAPPNYDTLVARHCLKFYPIGLDIKNILTENAKDFIGHTIKSIRKLKEMSEEVLSLQISSLMYTCKDADYLFASGNLVVGRTVADYYGIPYHHIFHIPQMLYSKYHPPVIVPWQRLPKLINLLFWRMTFFMFNMLWLKMLNRHRQKMGLDKIEDIYSYCFNKVIIAADSNLAFIPDDVKVDYVQTGYWYLEDDSELDHDLENFISLGTPPVYIGFGSMTNPSMQRMNRILNDAVYKSGLRFVISKGWAGLGLQSESSNVMVVNNVSHSKLFPKMSAIVHHGGAGTTLTAARAGKPQIIVPHMIDQYYWGERVCQLKLGPRPIKHSMLNGQCFTTILKETLNDKNIEQCTAELRDVLIKREDGVKEFIKKFSF